MSSAHHQDLLTADAFLLADQRGFGPAWRYELVRGRIVAHAAPSPDHGAIGANLTAELRNRLRGHAENCRVEIGSSAVPRREQRDTARIPDVMVRCGEHPRIVFEIVSPSELRNIRARDHKRQDLQAVDGVEEIVEVYQDEMAAHLYRRSSDGSWAFEAIGGAEALLELRSVGVRIPLPALYEDVPIQT